MFKQVECLVEMKRRPCQTSVLLNHLLAGPNTCTFKAFSQTVLSGKHGMHLSRINSTGTTQNDKIMVSSE